MQIKEAKVTKVVHTASTITDDWDDADCLCQGKVPTTEAVELAVRVQREQDQKWIWKVMVRTHADCPIHGTRRNQKD